MTSAEGKKEVRGLLKPAPDSTDPQPLIYLDELGSIPWPNAQEELEELIRRGVVRMMFRDVILQGRDSDGRMTQKTIARYFYTKGGELEEIDRLEETEHLSRTELAAGMLGLVELPENNIRSSETNGAPTPANDRND